MANFNFNKVILGGRLTADPVPKVTPSDVNVCSFTIAVNRRFTPKDRQQTEADYFNCTAWRQTAEFVSRYFRKASSICVVGHIETRSWVGQDGQKKFATEVVVDEAYFVDAKNEMPGVNAQGAYMPVTDTYIPQDYVMPNQAMETVDDGELLF